MININSKRLIHLNNPLINVLIMNHQKLIRALNKKDHKAKIKELLILRKILIYKKLKINKKI